MPEEVLKQGISKIINSREFIIVIGLVIMPIMSFALIGTSEESPLYTSISRIAWVLEHWWATFIWGVSVMGAILWLTYKTVSTGPLSKKAKHGILASQFTSSGLVLIGCLVFPAKSGSATPTLYNVLHDYVTIIFWITYGIGLFVYSVLLGKRDGFLGFLGLGLMSFTVFSSLFFIRQVILPDSYVGASAVSEVYIINSLFIYLVVMYVAQDYAAKCKADANAFSSEKE